jgi:hypothetical protein
VKKELEGKERYLVAAERKSKCGVLRVKKNPGGMRGIDFVDRG